MKDEVAADLGMIRYLCPTEQTKTFAEMTLPEKNIFSHRRKATEKLMGYLKREYIFLQ